MNTNIFETPVFRNKTIRTIVDEVLQKKGFKNNYYSENILDYFKIDRDQYDAIVKKEFVEDIYKKANDFVKSIEGKSVWQNVIEFGANGEGVFGLRRVFTTNKNGRLYDMDGDELLEDGTISLKNKRMIK